MIIDYRNMSSNTSCTIYVDTLIIFCLDDISDKQATAVIILLEKDPSDRMQRC